jgi:alcohol dehydrogenase, propanol-preferring
MRAMVLAAPDQCLQTLERPDPIPGDGEIRVKVSACGVCRTDLHVVDGELPSIKYPIVPGHEIVGRVDLVGGNVATHRVGDRVGIPWLGYTCGVCRFCREGMENLCDRPQFTGYTRDGGLLRTPSLTRAMLSHSAKTATMFRSRHCCAPALSAGDRS